MDSSSLSQTHPIDSFEKSEDGNDILSTNPVSKVLSICDENENLKKRLKCLENKLLDVVVENERTRRDIMRIQSRFSERIDKLGIRTEDHSIISGLEKIKKVVQQLKGSVRLLGQSQNEVLSSSNSWLTELISLCGQAHSDLDKILKVNGKWASETHLKKYVNSPQSSQKSPDYRRRHVTDSYHSSSSLQDYGGCKEVSIGDLSTHSSTSTNTIHPSKKSSLDSLQDLSFESEVFVQKTNIEDVDDELQKLKIEVAECHGLLKIAEEKIDTGHHVLKYLEKINPELQNSNKNV